MTSTTAPALPDTPAELLRAVRDLKKAADQADVEMMRLAVHWADLHLADPEFAEACFTSPKTFAGEGSPAIDEFCVPEFATMLGRTNDSAGRFLTECVEVAYRLPRLWGAVQAGLVAGWRARLIAQTTLALTLEAATYVDEQVFWCASRLTPRRWAAGRRGPGAVHARRGRARHWRGRPTSGTSPSTPQQVSFDGTMRLEADLEIPDALALAEAVKSGAAHLARLGSTDTIDGRRATALGDLARHQLTIGFDDPDDDDPGRLASRQDFVLSSTCGRPAKPVTQIVLYAHLSADAITHLAHDPGAHGAGEALCARVEQAGQRLLSVEQIRAWCGRPDVAVAVKPVIDLRERLECRGYTPTDEDPRARHRPRRDLCVPVVRPQRPPLRPRPHRPLRPRPPRPGRPDGDRQPRRPVPATPPVEDPRPVALRDDRPRRVHVDQPAGLHLPARPHRQPGHRTRLARARDPDSGPTQPRTDRPAARSTRPTSDHHAPDPATDDTGGAMRPTPVFTH